MYGQGYRNKAERKSNSRFVVSEKNKPGYGQKKEGGYAQNEKRKPSCGRLLSGKLDAAFFVRLKQALQST